MDNTQSNQQYPVLVPIYTPAPQSKKAKAMGVPQQFNVSWRKVGMASSIEEARKFCKHPILDTGIDGLEQCNP